jgi:hypothetical protein
MIEEMYMKRRVLGLVGAGLWVVAAGCAHGETFVKPTAEELSMTSLPGYPGVAAVVLFREETTQDDMHVVLHYERMKILTEDGKKFANIELPFVTTTGDGNYVGGDDKNLGQIEGRTIHADGTIIPFTGKPYLKVIEKLQGAKVQSRVFTLPDVEVGSILEYRYATSIEDNIFESPDWYIQGELYVKSAHYSWFPTNKELSNSRGIIHTITWYPILPEGVKVVRRDIPHGTFSQGPVQVFDLVIKDVPPIIKEDFQPPTASFSYRVLFNFTAERNFADWWKSEGKDWSKRMDGFADPNKELREATQGILAGAATDEEKLKNIYAAVMALENTRFTREHEQREDKAGGEGKVKTAADVLSHKRGSPTQLTLLFVGMARAAGMKAYVMDVPDRSEELFTEGWLSFQQFDDLIAIVNVGGKDVFLDPGWRYTPYGQLAWEHTYVRGLRQVDGGTDFANTTGDDYKANQTMRVANLKMNDAGEITGTIKLTFVGSPAIRWRHAALRGDDESLRHQLREHLEAMVPKTLEIKVDKIDGIEEYEKPLVVSYQVTGRLGTSTGKRLVMPVDVFEAEATASFPHEKREQAVYFSYPNMTKDAQRIIVPAGFSVEAVPEKAQFTLPGQEAYALTVTSDASGFTSRRDRIQGEIIVLLKDYGALRNYYVQFESKDQESVVVKTAGAGTASGGED